MVTRDDLGNDDLAVTVADDGLAVRAVIDREEDQLVVGHGHRQIVVAEVVARDHYRVDTAPGSSPFRMEVNERSVQPRRAERPFRRRREDL